MASVVEVSVQHERALTHSLRPIHSLHPACCYDYRLAPSPVGDPLKRAFDLVVSAAALAVLAIPFLIIAALIRLESPGPAVFRQTRSGFRGRAFEILKFRTMRGACEPGRLAQARPSDGRVTRIGKLLRRSSFDELPQLVNVLRGEMSIVGPRPHALLHDRVFYGVDEDYPRRFMARPGITGLAQISGARGLTDTPDKVRRRLRYDIAYIENWSLWGDMVIVARTFHLVLFDRNAF